MRCIGCSATAISERPERTLKGTGKGTGISGAAPVANNSTSAVAEYRTGASIPQMSSRDQKPIWTDAWVREHRLGGPLRSTKTGGTLAVPARGVSRSVCREGAARRDGEMAGLDQPGGTRRTGYRTT